MDIKYSHLNKIILSFIIIIQLVSFSSCKKSRVEENVNEESNWELFWSDEFNADTLNTGVWRIENTPKTITSRTSRSKNLRVENGTLIMELHKELDNGMSFTGSEITTRGSKLYGKFECRAKLPAASRAWPAFWLLGDFSGEYGVWPKCGEIDIVEYWGYNDPNIFTNIHTEHSNWQNNNDREKHATSISVSDARDEFHIYAMEWSKDQLNFLIDDELYWTYNKLDENWEKWPFDKPLHVLFMLYAAPDWNGSDADLPAKFIIDYVRVYDAV